MVSHQQDLPTMMNGPWETLREAFCDHYSLFLRSPHQLESLYHHEVWHHSGRNSIHLSCEEGSHPFQLSGKITPARQRVYKKKHAWRKNDWGQAHACEGVNGAKGKALQPWNMPISATISESFEAWVFKISTRSGLFLRVFSTAVYNHNEHHKSKGNSIITSGERHMERMLNAQPWPGL